MIKTTFSLTEEEYIEAQRLYSRKTQKRQRRLRLTIVGIIVVSFSFVLLTGGSMELGKAFVGLLMPLTLVASFLCIPLLERRAWKKRFAIEGKGLQSVLLEVDEDGLRTRVQGTGEGLLEWPAFSDCLEGATVFALIRGFTFHPIPKKALTSEQQADLRLLLQRKIAAK